MSGTGTFTGTGYQEQVLAVVSVHILARSPLQWFGSEDDTPIGLSAETLGPGDDVAVILADTSRSFEIQCKRGLTGGNKLREAVEVVAAGFKARPRSITRVVFAVDPTSSKPVQEDFKRDLERLRSGRRDFLNSDAKALMDDGQAETLGRLTLVCLGLEDSHSAHRQNAVLRLEACLQDKSKALAAWDILVADATEICAKRLGRDRSQLVALLTSRGIAVAPLAAEEHRQLDVCEQLLDDWYLSAAADRLDGIERTLTPEARADSTVRYRIACARTRWALRSDNAALALNHARLAMSLQQPGNRALRLAAASCLKLNKVPEAEEHIGAALQVDRFDVRVWVLKLSIELKAGRQPTVPPSVVAGSAAYRACMAENALQSDDTSTALTLTEEVLATGDRSPEYLIVRSRALLTRRPSPTASDVGEALSLSSEIVATLRNEDDPRLLDALFLRGWAHTELGDLASAEKDFARFRERKGASPEILTSLAMNKAQRGDLTGALAVLSHEAVDREPVPLAFRSKIHTKQGNSQAGREEALQALGLLTSESPVATKVSVAEALLDAGERKLADPILESPSVLNDRSPHALTLRGRVAFDDGKVELGTEAFRAVSTAGERFRVVALLELADLLRKANRLADSTQVLEGLAATPVQDLDLPRLATSLYRAGKLVVAQQLIDRAFSGASVPAWALRILYAIAERQENIEAVVERLRQLLSQRDDLETRAFLARALFELGDNASAETEAREVINRSEVTPELRMQMAMLLAHLQVFPLALQKAYESYRERRSNPEMHEGLVLVSVHYRGDVVPVTKVAPRTFVRLRLGEQTREYTIVASGEALAPTELTAARAEGLGLMGKEVGQLVAFSGLMEPAQWKVEEVLADYHHGVQEVFANYETLFPERNFIRAMPVPTGETVGDLLPLVHTTEAKKRIHQALLEAAYTGCWPIGAVASRLGRSVEEAMAAMRASRGLVVESQARHDHARAVNSASHADCLVLTRTSLVTASQFGFLTRLADRYKLVAPKTLKALLRSELLAAERLLAIGRTGVAAGEAGPTILSIPAGDPMLVGHHRKVADLLSWASEHVSFHPRPLDHLESEDSLSREGLAWESYDAAELAHSLGATLYADDLGLRVFGQRWPGLLSASSFAILEALRSGFGDEREVMRMRQNLILQNYRFAHPTAELLVFATSRPDLSHKEVQTLFDTLSCIPTLGDAATVAAQAIRQAAIADIQAVAFADVVDLVLSGMSKGWPPKLVVQALLLVIRDQLRFLGRRHEEVAQRCLEFLRLNLIPTVGQ